MTWAILGVICAMVLVVLVFIRLIQSKFPVNVVPDWRGLHKLLSTWVATAWAAAFGYVVEHPLAASDAWHAIPEDLRPDVPHWLKMGMVGFAVLASLLAARIIKQPALRPGDQQNP